MPSLTEARTEPAFSVDHVAKTYGETRALADTTLAAQGGEVIGLIGHNGAGKSTLMRIIAGITDADRGEMAIAGERIEGSLSPRRATELGIRVVHQELSLCANLRVYENLVIRYPGRRGWRWRAECRRLTAAALDRVFPGHGIAVTAPLGDLSLGQRQMVEIAIAVAEVGTPMRLLMLDEPTSALDAVAAGQLFDYVRSAAAGGLTCLLVSHRLAEIQARTDRIVVLRDGGIVFDGATREIDRDGLVRLMGEPRAQAPAATREQRVVSADGPPRLAVTDLRTHRLDGVTIAVRPGEVVGLAGLEGHGQRDVLRAVYAAGRRRNGRIRLDGTVAYVAGDRRTEGVFSQWSVSRNITVASLRGLLLSGAAERRLVGDWVERLGLLGRVDGSIDDLSGGNQQKALFARALATTADLVLLDDPTRGVDLGTKARIYEIVREEAAKGRSFLWYSTENEELSECDRCYVLRDGRIVDEVDRAGFSEERVVDASFRDRAGGDA